MQSLFGRIGIERVSINDISVISQENQALRYEFLLPVALNARLWVEAMFYFKCIFADYELTVWEAAERGIIRGYREFHGLFDIAYFRGNRNDLSRGSPFIAATETEQLRIFIVRLPRYNKPRPFDIYEGLSIQKGGFGVISSRIDGAPQEPNLETANQDYKNSGDYQHLVPSVFHGANAKWFVWDGTDCQRLYRMDTYVAFAIVGLWAACLVLIPVGGIRWDRGRRRSGAGLIGLGIMCNLVSLPLALYGWPGTWGISPYPCRSSNQPNKNYEFHANNVPQKHLTSNNNWGTVIDMANVLNTDKQIAVIGALAEGSSIRSIERITGVHRDTIMRLGVKVGKGCAALLDAKMRDLPCKYLEFDEIWGFIGKKEKHVSVDDSPELGDVWTFCAVDAETKIVPTFRCGKRDRATANAFVQDVASRMKNRVQISTDGLRSYVEAIEKSFGAEVDFAQIVKTYTHDVEIQPNRRYSAPEIVSTEKKIFTGSPEIDHISTSYVERLNGTTRTHMRRLTRLTLAFSKKLENFEAAVGLHFAYYNFVKRHNTLRCTPAMAAGIEQSFLSVGDLVEASA